MKNIIKLFSIIALIAVIGFSFAACNFDDDKDDDNGGSGGNSNRLTVTNLPNPNNTWAAAVYDAGTNVSTNVAEGSAFQYTRYTGTNGGNGNVFHSFVTKSPPYSYWTGSGNWVVVLISSSNGSRYYGTVNFSSGSATKNFNSDFTLQPVN